MLKQIQRKKQLNRGFSLIELLIAMTIISIVMLMVVSFMSSTSAAYKKTLSNQEVQKESDAVNANLESMMMSANYVRISSKDGKFYELTYGDNNSYSATAVASKSCPGYDFVPDNYPNYVSGYGKATDESKDVILNTDFQIITSDGKRYPLSDNSLYEEVADLGTTDTAVFSLRALSYDYDATNKKFVRNASPYYIKPDYIYMEYSVLDPDPTDDKNNYLGHVIYGFTYRDLKTDTIDWTMSSTVPTGKLGVDYAYSVYMYRYYTYEKSTNVYVTDSETAITSSADTSWNMVAGGYVGYGYAKDILPSKASSTSGVLTELLTQDYYVSADADSNTLFLNFIYNGPRGYGYTYYGRQSISSRTTYSLTAKPQKLKQYVNGTVEEATYQTSGGGGDDEDGGGTGGNSEEDSGGGGNSENPPADNGES